jgi:hypothetical protein
MRQRKTTSSGLNVKNKERSNVHATVCSDRRSSVESQLGDQAIDDWKMTESIIRE